MEPVVSSCQKNGIHLYYALKTDLDVCTQLHSVHYNSTCCSAIEKYICIKVIAPGIIPLKWIIFRETLTNAVESIHYK